LNFKYLFGVRKKRILNIVGTVNKIAQMKCIKYSNFSHKVVLESRQSVTKLS